MSPRLAQECLNGTTICAQLTLVCVSRNHCLPETDEGKKDKIFGEKDSPEHVCAVS